MSSRFIAASEALLFVLSFCCGRTTEEPDKRCLLKNAVISNTGIRARRSLKANRQADRFVGLIDVETQVSSALILAVSLANVASTAFAPS